MQVVTVETSAGQTRYYLANDDGTPVEPVLKYLRFRDNAGAARNTLRLACIFLKHYFTYLEKRGLRWQAVTIDDLADFLAWLKYPRIEEKVIPLNLEPKYRSETINAILDTVLAFYHYEYLRGGLDNNVSEKLVTFIKSPHGAYRSFLDGIADRKREKRYLLRLPAPKRVIRTVAKEDVEAVMKACANVRDYFLMYLLFETGMRIVLSIASKLSELRPDVAKEVIAQFPEFVKLIQSSMSEYKDILGNIISSDDESIKQVYAIADKELNISADSRKQFYDFAEKVHADLSKCLDNPQLSAEEREAILEKEMEILRTVSEKDTEIRSQETETVHMVDKKDSEKRQFNWGIVKVASSVLVAGLVIGVSVLGGNVNIKLPKKI